MLYRSAKRDFLALHIAAWERQESFHLSSCIAEFGNILYCYNLSELPQQEYIQKRNAPKIPLL
jgi:hypothetical protein